MKNTCKIFAPRVLLSFAIVASIACFACSKKTDIIQDTDIMTLPSVTVRNFRTVFMDSGKINLILSSPLMESYNNAESPYSEFISGLEVQFYDGNENPIGTVNCKYAKYTEKKKIWELKDSVIVVNEENDMLETELLFWDQEKDLIYTDRFVKITNEDQTVMGSGFESDPRLTRRRIKNVTATIYLHDE